MEAVKSKTTNRPSTVRPAASRKQTKPEVRRGNGSIRLQSFTPKISSPKDPAEKEANATAQKIMRMTVPNPAIASANRNRGGLFRQVQTEEKDEKLQTKLRSPYILRFAKTGIFPQSIPEKEKIQPQVEEEEPDKVQPQIEEKEEPNNLQTQLEEKEPETVQPQVEEKDPETVQPQVEEKEEPNNLQTQVEEKEEPDKVQPQVEEKEEPNNLQTQVKEEEPETVQPQVEEKEEPDRLQTQVKEEEPETVQPQVEEKEEPNNLQTQVEEEEPETVQPQAEGQPHVTSNIIAEIQRSKGSGSPLPLSTRRFMEPRFQADFSRVKIHTDDKAAQYNRQLQARAFTLGNDIFFAKNKFQPESQSGKALIAHELTHTIQQGVSAQRKEEESWTDPLHNFGKTVVKVVTDPAKAALEYIANKAQTLESFSLLTMILGKNPINDRPVNASPVQMMREVVKILPGGKKIDEALNNHGIYEKVATWVAEKVNALKDVVSGIGQAIDTFIERRQWSDVTNLSAVWTEVEQIFTVPINRAINECKGSVSEIVQWIKDLLLPLLAALAAKLPGYDLLKAVLGKDPITDEAYEPNAEVLIGGFMKLIGREDLWQNIQEAKAIPKMVSWWEENKGTLKGVVEQIPAQFNEVMKALKIDDIVELPTAMKKVATVFVTVASKFVSWGLNAVWDFLEIIFEAVAPEALSYIRKAGDAMRSILENPIAFVGNLIQAGKAGLNAFASNIGKHLKTSLIRWLTGTLAGTGVYIPQALSIREIIKFALSVLGITWRNIRKRLVRILGERKVRAMEKGVALVQRLVAEGPGAVWQQIAASVGDLQGMVIGGIISFVTTKIVQSALAKLVSMLHPVVGGFIQGAMAIYNTAMFFIDRGDAMVEVAGSLVGSIGAIAHGAIAAAAKLVENTLVGVLTLAIRFLAGQVGLGNVGKEVSKLLKNMGKPIDLAMDKAIASIAKQARKFGRRLARAGVPKDKQKRERLAAKAAVAVASRLKGRVTRPLLRRLMAGIRIRYSLCSIEPYVRGGKWWVRIVASPATNQPLNITEPCREEMALIRRTRKFLITYVDRSDRFVTSSVEEGAIIFNDGRGTIYNVYRRPIKGIQTPTIQRRPKLRLSDAAAKTVATFPQLYMDPKGWVRSTRATAQKNTTSNKDKLRLYYQVAQKISLRELSTKVQVPDQPTDKELETIRGELRQHILATYITLDAFNGLIAGQILTGVAMQGNVFEEWIVKNYGKTALIEDRVMYEKTSGQVGFMDRHIPGPPATIVEMKSRKRPRSASLQSGEEIPAKKFVVNSTDKTQYKEYRSLLEGTKRAFKIVKKGEVLKDVKFKKIRYYFNYPGLAEKFASTLAFDDKVERYVGGTPYEAPKEKRVPPVRRDRGQAEPGKAE